MAKYINTILSTLLVFVLTFAWMNYCTHIFVLSILISCAMAICSGTLVYLISDKNEIKTKSNKHDKQNLAQFEQYVTFCEKQISVFLPLLTNHGYTIAETQNDYALCEKDNEKTMFVALFTLDKPSIDTLRKYVINSKNTNSQKLVFITNNLFNTNVFPVKVEIISHKDIYNLLKDDNLLPNVAVEKYKKHNIVKEYIFNKKRFAWYISSALFMAVSSLWSMFKIYSLVWATAFAVVAFYSLFNKKYNIETQSIL